MKKFFSEFKDFIMKGNVIDLAVAFVMGAAFKAIISSMVKDVIMPVLSLLFGEEGFENYKYVITAAVVDTEGAVTQVENAIYWGKFIQSTIDFVIIGFVLFLVVKTINTARKHAEAKSLAKEAAEAAAAPVVEPKATVEELLGDIKGLLEKK